MSAFRPEADIIAVLEKHDDGNRWLGKCHAATVGTDRLRRRFGGPIHDTTGATVEHE